MIPKARAPLSKIEIGLILALFVIAGFWTWIFLGAPLDDAYVYARYAQNFIHGHGLVFNLGEHVEGYSTYLWQLLLCLGTWLGAPADPLAQGLSIFFYFLVIVLLTWWARERIRQSYIYLLVPAFFVFSLANNFWTGLALETMMYAFMLLSSLILYLKCDGSRWQRVFVGLWCCLLSFSRPEAVAFYALILAFEFVYQWQVKKSIQWMHLFEYSVGLFIFIFYIYTRWQFYGYVLPNTYYVKVGYNVKVWTHGFAYLMSFINTTCGGALLFGLMMAYGTFFRRNRGWWLFFLAAITFFVLVMLSGGNNWSFWRYALPCSPILAFLMGDFFEGAFGFIKEVKGAWKLISRTVFCFLAAFILMRGTFDVLLDPMSYRFLVGNKAFLGCAKFRGLLYKEILYPNQSVALEAMPCFAYYYEGWIYDMLGLVDADIAHRKVEMGIRVQSHEKGDGYHILAMRPTLIHIGGPLDVLSEPNRQYPKPESLYYLSDIEVARQREFVNLYEPYNILVPSVQKYVPFYKLKLQHIKVIPPGKIDAIYQETIGAFNEGENFKLLNGLAFGANYLISGERFIIYSNISKKLSW